VIEFCQEKSVSQDFCFCTLAVGSRYRAHAELLAQDLQQYAPTIPLLVLTDRPQQFAPYPQVIAIKHFLQSVKGYHDKRLVLQAASDRYEICTFLDADVRILGPVSLAAMLEFPPGLTARFGCGILKHNQHTKVRKALPLIQSVAQALNLDLDQVIWFHEFMFTLRRQDGREQEFFEYWKKIAYYFELNDIYDGEGNVIGLSAAAAGLNIGFRRMDLYPYFKDKIEKEQIRAGKADPQMKRSYFDVHHTIEYPPQNLANKAVLKLQKQADVHYRRLRLQLKASLDQDFQDLNAMIADPKQWRE
jgi:hypothetical protein